MGNHHIDLPNGYTWKTFSEHILNTIPPKTAEHYKNKIAVYLKWWQNHGYTEGIPDEADLKLEMQGKAPAWRRIAKTLLKNDYWCKYLGFSPTKTSAYEKYMQLMKKRRSEWGILT